jgi:glycerophosphoryl diester phosphodiesterase
MNILEQLRKPVIFAHRGASLYAPENTLAAFQLALEQNADGIELDAKMTRDNQVVVIHDQTVERTTNGTGKVRRMTLMELKQLDAGSFFSPNYRGEKIPTLDEVLERFGGQLFINIELTNYASPADALPKKAAELVLAHNLQEHVIFSSFLFTNLVRVHRILPQAHVALLTIPGRSGGPVRSRIGRWVSPLNIHPHLKDANAGFIAAQHQSGRRVHVWTVNHRQDMQQLFSWNVDGIFTDDPQLAIQVREG